MFFFLNSIYYTSQLHIHFPKKSFASYESASFQFSKHHAQRLCKSKFQFYFSKINLQVYNLFSQNKTNMKKIQNKRTCGGIEPQFYEEFYTIATQFFDPGHTPHKPNPTRKNNCYQPIVLQKSYVLQPSCNSPLSKPLYVEILLQVEFNLQLTSRSLSQFLTTIII